MTCYTCCTMPLHCTYLHFKLAQMLCQSMRAWSTRAVQYKQQCKPFAPCYLISEWRARSLLRCGPCLQRCLAPCSVLQDGFAKGRTRNTYPKAAAPVTCMVICPSCVKMFTSLPDLAAALRLVISSSTALLMVPAYAERFSEWNMG